MKTTPMFELVRVDRQAGEVGIEVELEGEGCAFISANNMWRVETDGSLRGESVEIVLKKPCKRGVIPARLKLLSHMIKEVRFVDSGRAGIHIHINIQELTQRELTQFICLYMVFEEALVSWCGEGRVGNLFCLQVSDAPFVLKVLRDVVKTGRWLRLATDTIRYSSMNLKAIATYGSLEFRALRSTTDTAVIRQWINILLRLKDVSKTYEHPGNIIEEVSRIGEEAFFHSVLGDFNVPYMPRALSSGVRNAQFIAYTPPAWEKEQIIQPEWAPDPIQERIDAVVRREDGRIRDLVNAQAMDNRARWGDVNIGQAIQNAPQVALNHVDLRGPLVPRPVINDPHGYSKWAKGDQFTLYCTQDGAMWRVVCNREDTRRTYSRENLDMMKKLAPEKITNQYDRALLSLYQHGIDDRL